MGRPGPLGFGWPSLCNRVAQTWGSVPGSTQEPMATMKVALVAARLGQRPKTTWRMESVVHTLILGEHKANINGPGTLRFLAIGDAQRSSAGRANRSFGRPLRSILKRQRAATRDGRRPCVAIRNVDFRSHEFLGCHFPVCPVSSQSTDFPNSLLMANNTAEPGSFSPCSRS